MHAAEFRKLLDQRPFEPIRLHISSEQHVNVRPREMAIVSRSPVAVGVARGGRVADYTGHYNLLHVVKVEPLNRQRGAQRAARRGSRYRIRPVKGTHHVGNPAAAGGGQYQL